MNYLIVVLAIISIILVLLCKFLNLSIIYPTLIIILVIVLDILSNIIAKRNKEKNGTDIYKIVNNKSNKK
jgi:hypothetical protein